MSGPVRPPLTVAESDGNPTVRPVNTIAFNSADFTLTDQGGATVRVDVNPGGGTSLTDTQVGFGDSSNLLTGSSLFTYNDTAGSELLTLKGSGNSDLLKLESSDTSASSAPDLVLYRNPSDGSASVNDFIGRFDFRGLDSTGADRDYGIIATRIMSPSSGTLKGYGRMVFFVADGTTPNLDNSQLTIERNIVTVNNANRGSVDFAVKGTSTQVIRVDGSQNNMGIGTSAPSSSVERLHVKGSDASKDLVMFESDDTDGNDDGPDLVLYRSKESPGDGTQLGSIKFRGRNNATADIGYAHIEAEVESGFGTSANGLLRFGVVADGTTPTDILYVSGNGSTPNVGIGTSSPNTNTLLHISDDGSKINTVRIESTDNDTNVGPVLDLRRNNADGTATDGDKLGVIQFTGLDDIGGGETYARIIGDAVDTHSTQATGRVRFIALEDGSEIEYLRYGFLKFNVNANHEAGLDFVIDSQESGAGFHNIYADSGQNNVGMGCVPDSGVERLHLKGTGTGSMLRLESTDGGATSAPDLELYRNSGSPATDDFVGTINFTAETLSSSIKVTTGQILMQLKDISGDNINSDFVFNGRSSNATKQFLKLGHDSTVFNSENADIDFQIETQGNPNMFKIDSGLSKVAIGQGPTSAGAQFQVNDDAEFLSQIINKNSTTILSAAEVKNSKIISNPSGSDATITLPQGAQGMRVTVVNASASNTVTVAFDVGDTAIEAASGTFPRAMTTAQVETWLCYKDLNWVLENFV